MTLANDNEANNRCEHDTVKRGNENNGILFAPSNNMNRRKN